MIVIVPNMAAVLAATAGSHATKIKKKMKKKKRLPKLKPITIVVEDD